MDDREISVYLFYCANSMTESESQGLRARLGVEGVKLLSLPCSGKVTVPYLLKAFEKGAHGVAIVTCVPGACCNLEGNLRASRRAEAVAALLDEIGLGKGRIVAFGKEQDDAEKIIETMRRFRETLRGMPGPRCHAESLPVATLHKSDFNTANRQETSA
jgi:coenzyme F420-reducing hydrogenase delta subunit